MPILHSSSSSRGWIVVSCFVFLWNAINNDNGIHGCSGFSMVPSQRRGGARSGGTHTIDGMPLTTRNAGAVSSYLATCHPGLAPVLCQEITEILNAGRVDDTEDENDTDTDAGEVLVVSGSAVSFETDLEGALRVLVWSRVAVKLMELLFSTTTSDMQDDRIESRDDLYDLCRRYVDVKDLLGDGQGGLLTLAVSVVLRNALQIPKDVSHTHYSALTIKNALVDSVRDLRANDRPSVDTDNPDVPLVAILTGRGDMRRQPMATNHNNHNLAADLFLYRQLHEGSLHRRGYKSDVMHKASLKESLAAGLLRHAGWPLPSVAAVGAPDNDSDNDNDDDIVLVDPMAGSGTMIVEAALMAAKVAPALLRIKCGVPNAQYPSVTRWKHKNLVEQSADNSNPPVRQLWEGLLREAATMAREGTADLRQQTHIRFVANDIHPGALDLLEQAVANAGLEGLVEVQEGDCRDVKLELSVSKKTQVMVVTNPPWGVRLSSESVEDLEASWTSLGDFLRSPMGPSDDNDVADDNRKSFTTTQAWILSGSKDSTTRNLRLRRSSSLPLKTGDQTLRWLQYDIHDRSSNGADDDFDTRTTSARRTSVDDDGDDDYRKKKPFDDASGQYSTESNRRGHRQHQQPQQRQLYTSSSSHQRDASVRVQKKKGQQGPKRKVSLANNDWLID